MQSDTQKACVPLQSCVQEAELWCRRHHLVRNLDHAQSRNRSGRTAQRNTHWREYSHKGHCIASKATTYLASDTLKIIRDGIGIAFDTRANEYLGGLQTLVKPIAVFSRHL